MKIIVGLGNPGEKYSKTYHNVGFLSVDFLREYFNFEDFVFNQKFSALISSGLINNEKILIVKPQTYMNNSGESVQKILSFYKLDSKNILVIYDDFEIPFGTLRVRLSGSDGGHLGVRSIINKIATQDFPRIRVGIKLPGKAKKPLEEIVLSKFKKEELEFLQNSIFAYLPSLVLDFIKNQLKNETINFKNGGN